MDLWIQTPDLVVRLKKHELTELSGKVFLKIITSRKLSRFFFTHSTKMYLNQSKTRFIAKQLLQCPGGAATNSVISSRIATSIAQSSSLFVKLRGGIIGNTLQIVGMIEWCLYTSERLHQVNSEIYYALRQRNFDLLYFILEPPLTPFIEALNVRRTQGQPAFERIIDIVSSEINAKK